MANIAAIYAGPADPAVKAALGRRPGRRPAGRRPGAYVNFLADEGEARVHEAYPGATWTGWARSSGRYDPDNLFRRNQNVPPAGA